MLYSESSFNFKSLGAFALGTLLIISSQLALAHPPGRGGGGWHGGGGGGWHGGGGGFFFGGSFPLFPPPYPVYSYPYSYSYPYVYNPPTVVITQPQPQVYIEQGSSNTSSSNTGNTTSANASNNSGYWYYCEASDSYYPYVKECMAGWKQVTPTPPPSATTR